MRSKVLLINPNKWGRGITSIWIASHSGVLKRNAISVELFDCTFYEEWHDNEINLNTENSQFKKTDYNQKVKYNKNSIIQDFQKKIDEYQPDIIFWSALSSHIHGEGEYINIEYGYDLIKNAKIKKAIKICGGIQTTHDPESVYKKFKNIDYFISGESEKILLEVAKSIDDEKKIKSLNGINFFDKKKSIFVKNKPQEIIQNLDEMSPYDYEIFNKNVFLRPYNGKVLNAVDFEISRGCIYTCSYCVETIIQKYYGFKEYNKNGTLLNFKKYLRNKSAQVVYDELKNLNKNLNISLFRMQDTNFLTIDRNMLLDLSELLQKNPLNIKLYIETRAEGINDKTIELLKNLNVDGVGMGLELSDESFRQTKLNRFVNQEKIENAFKLLKKNNINRTAYNIIGLPDQNEQSIIETIKFNIKLAPDVSSVAYYSKYDGTDLTKLAKNNFEKNTRGMDAQIRSKIINHNIDSTTLEFYKMNFNILIKNKLKSLEKLKSVWLDKLS